MSEHSIHDQPGAFRKRMRWAILCALAVHACLFVVPMGYRDNGTLFIPPASETEPVVVSLQPQDKPKELITPVAPAAGPVDPSANLIAERDSKAQDMTPGDNGGSIPDAGAVGPNDDITTAPVSEKPATPVPEVATASEPTAPEAKPEPQAAPRPKENHVTQAAAAAPAADTSKSVAPAIPEPAAIPPDAPIQLAKADNPNAAGHTMGKTQSSVDGNVKSIGFLSFEAQQNEFAPYLRDVRTRVEKRWKAIMHLGYTGVSTAQAVLDCAITPDGKLERVAIVDSGDSATFAGLCKQAIEQAGPFGPFPFQVPAMYQDRNIEIRWTFNFL